MNCKIIAIEINVYKNKNNIKRRRRLKLANFESLGLKLYLL
jgi:hypothetical protein